MKVTGSRPAVRLGMLVSAVALVVAMVPATPASAVNYAQSISGNAWDNSGGAKGVIVEISTGTWTADTSTDASGNYTLSCPTGNYSVKFMDSRPNPTQIYATRWYDTQTSGGSATVVHVAASAAVTGIDEYMSPAVTIKTTVRRWQNALTAIAGETVVATHRDGDNVLDTYYGTTGADGTAAIGGLPHGDYTVQVVDPSGLYWTQWPEGAFTTFGSGTTWNFEADMVIKSTASDVAVSAPSSKSTVKKNKAFKSSGTLSKAVGSPTKMKIVAYKKSGSNYVAWKTFSAKIVKKSASSTYSATVTLPKGKYVLYAVFPGSTIWATANSAGRTVTSK